MLLLISKVRRGLKKNNEKALMPTRITPEQAAVLYIITNSSQDVSPSQLAKLMLREAQTITGILNRMEKKGLIKRSNNRQRRNVVKIAITKKGEAAYTASLCAREPLREILSVLSEKEYSSVWTSLKKVLNASLERLG